MNLPLSFAPGRLQNGLLLKTPKVLDADGKRVFELAFTPALHPATLSELNSAAQLFAAAPDVVAALEVQTNVLVEYFRDFTHLHPAIEACIASSRVAIAKAQGVHL